MMPLSHEMFEHHGVSCDGCGATPLLGPRFKCENCHDYDLCGNCFPHKEALHNDHDGKHSFHCQLKGSMKGYKGLGKGWGKGWGKGCAASGKGLGAGIGKAFWAAMVG